MGPKHGFLKSNNTHHLYLIIISAYILLITNNGYICDSIHLVNVTYFQVKKDTAAGKPRFVEVSQLWCTIYVTIGLYRENAIASA